MVLGDALQVPRRERQESFRFEKLPGDDDNDQQPGLWQSMIELKDFHLFLFCCCGLIGVNVFIGTYFSLLAEWSWGFVNDRWVVIELIKVESGFIGPLFRPTLIKSSNQFLPRRWIYRYEEEWNTFRRMLTNSGCFIYALLKKVHSIVGGLYTGKVQCRAEQQTNYPVQQKEKRVNSNNQLPIPLKRGRNAVN